MATSAGESSIHAARASARLPPASMRSAALITSLRGTLRDPFRPRVEAREARRPAGWRPIVEACGRWMSTAVRRLLGRRVEQPAALLQDAVDVGVEGGERRIEPAGPADHLLGGLGHPLGDLLALRHLGECGGVLELKEE